MTDTVCCPLCLQPWATHTEKCRPMLELEFAGQGDRVRALLVENQLGVPAEGTFRWWHAPLVWALMPIVAVIWIVERLRPARPRDPERDSFPWGAA